MRKTLKKMIEIIATEIERRLMTEYILRYFDESANKDEAHGFYLAISSIKQITKEITK